jgi:hypothetical protein
VHWQWGGNEQRAFERFKEAFSSAPVLRIPDQRKPFILETDASKVATGGTLWQRAEDGEFHPCGHISQSLDAHQQNYQIYDQELLAIMHGLDEW